MILTKSCGQRDPLSEMDDVSRSVVMSLKQRIINHNFLMVNLENHGVDTVNDMALTSEANLNCACVCACVCVCGEGGVKASFPLGSDVQGLLVCH